MERTLIKKMILQCLKTFHIEDSPLSEEDLNQLIDRIIQTKSIETEIDLYEIIHDEVYDYLKNN